MLGGLTGGYMMAQAASTPSSSASPSATAPLGPPGGGPSDAAARAEDLQQAATAIGITQAQLQTELSGGKTIAMVATEHGVAVSKVVDALVASENSEIDQRASSGQITSTQATQEKAHTTERVTGFVNGTPPPGGPHGPGGRGGLQAEDQQVVATAIGITTTQLQTELTAGKTIAAVATEHNVAVSKVIDALVASENNEIDQRVSSGQLTSAQGTQEKTHTTQRITDEVNGTHPAGGPGGWGPGGPPPAGAPGASSTTQ